MYPMYVLPADATAERMKLQLRDTSSLLLLPLGANGHPSGFVTFETVSRKHHWSNSSIQLLNIAALTIGTALFGAATVAKHKKEEAFYRTIFEHTGTAMIVLGKDMSIADVNQRIEQLSGYTKDEILSGDLKWHEFIVQDDQEKVGAYHQARLQAAENVPTSYEARFFDKNGRKGNAVR